MVVPGGITKTASSASTGSAKSGSSKVYNSLRSSYALSGTGIRCWYKTLRACFAVSATDKSYLYNILRASPVLRLQLCYAMSGTDLVYAAPCYARATRCPVLTEAMLLPDTSIGLCRNLEGGMLLRAAYAKSGTDVAQSGTDIAHGAYWLWQSSTDSAYGARVRGVPKWTGSAPPIGLRACYAMSGTKLAQDGRPTRLLRHVRSPIDLRACYSMSGTDVAYAAIDLPVLLRCDP
eukprot:1782492-Rhodomonas_salina.3